MLDALKFVKGAVATKSLVPELTHFYIGNGRIKGYNGKLGLCSPIALDIEACPEAGVFVKAIETSQETIAIRMLDNGAMEICSGAFKACIPCLEPELLDIEPEGEFIELTGDFLPSLKKLYPFIAEDASRPWARGILLRGQSAFATNNVVLVEQWMPSVFPLEINIPQGAVKELLRINENPLGINISEDSATFHFENGRWLRTALYAINWPDVEQILGLASEQSPLPPGFFEALEKMLPFTDEYDKVFFEDNCLRTHYEDNLGAAVTVNGVLNGPCFNMRHMLSIKDVARTIDFTKYPAPCIFYGDNLRGAIVGMNAV